MDEELDIPYYPLVVVVGTSAALTAICSCALMCYALIRSPQFGDQRHLLVYILAIGLTGLLQAMYEAYLVLGELKGFLATKGITGCIIIAFVEKYLESLPFMLFAAFCTELGDAFSCCMKRRRIKRALLVLFQILLTILALNLAVFVNTRIFQAPDQDEVFLCVNTIPTRRMLLALRVSALGIGYVVPFLILVFLHLLRFFSSSFPYRRAGLITAAVFALRWISWLPIHVHVVLLDLGLVHRLLDTAAVIRLHRLGSMVMAVAGVLELLLLIGLVALIANHLHRQGRMRHAQRMMQETSV